MKVRELIEKLQKLVEEDAAKADLDVYIEGDPVGEVAIGEGYDRQPVVHIWWRS